MKHRALAAFILLGLVSLFADIAYEGMRGSVGGLLEILGAPLTASAILAFGEAMSYIGRLIAGSVAYRYASPKIYKILLLTGYGLNIVVVIMAFASQWLLVVTLFFLERLGKGLRAPIRDVLVSELVTGIGRGKGFGLYELMDQVGAVVGPLVVAYLVAGQGYRIAYTALITPIAASLIALSAALTVYPWTRIATGKRGAVKPRIRLLIIGLSLTYAGFTYWPLLAQRMVAQGLSLETPSILYSLAMLIDAVAALGLGALYDRYGSYVVLAAPIVTTLSSSLAILGHYSLAAICWGVVVGFYESVFRAIVADRTTIRERALAFAALHLLTGLAWGAGSLAQAILDTHTYLAYLILTETLAIITITHSLQKQP